MTTYSSLPQYVSNPSSPPDVFKIRRPMRYGHRADYSFRPKTIAIGYAVTAIYGLKYGFGHHTLTIPKERYGVRGKVCTYISRNSIPFFLLRSLLIRKSISPVMPTTFSIQLCSHYHVSLLCFFTNAFLSNPGFSTHAGFLSPRTLATQSRLSLSMHLVYFPCGLFGTALSKYSTPLTGRNWFSAIQSSISSPIYFC